MNVESLERTMLALSDAREAHDVLGVAARSLGRDFRRRCVAYELRDAHFRPVPATDILGAEPISAGDVDVGGLRMHGVVRRGARDLVAISSDGQLRGLLVLEDAEGVLLESDVKHLRAVAAYVSLALASALAFDQLRRYAAEGAALGEAAKTMLSFTTLEPLAESLCGLAVRLVQADWAAMYVYRDGAAVRVAGAALPGEDEAPASLVLDAVGPAGVAPFTAPYVVVPLATGSGATAPSDGGALLVAARAVAFEKPDLRLIDALASLAALALRNVDSYEQSARANQALAESNAFKDDLMAMFAHDFRGPLTVISGYSELLLDSGDPEARRSAQTILEQTRRLAHLSEDALALAATQSAGFSLQRKREDLTAFVRVVAGALDPGGERVVFEAPTAPVVASFDRTRLRHVFENVIGNALKYSTGSVVVRVSSAAATVRIDVRDSGIGIPAGEMERIFSRFGRASNAGTGGVSGSGVGLYIAKKIVEVHGGRLDVVSTENRGSTFTVTLSL